MTAAIITIAEEVIRTPGENQGAATTSETARMEETLQEVRVVQEVEAAQSSPTQVPAHHQCDHRGTISLGLAGIKVNHGLGLATPRSRLCTS